VITTDPSSIAAATEVLFARTPSRKKAAKNVARRSSLCTATSERFPRKYRYGKISCSSSNTSWESRSEAVSWFAAET
jgi:hypothetical protein